MSAFKLVLNHEDAFRSRNPDLERTYLAEPELKSGLSGECWRDIAHTISKGVAVPHDVLHTERHLFWSHDAHELRRAEALALSRKFLEHICLLAEVTHTGLNVILTDL